MKRGYMLIELLSDLCTADGDGAAGIVDTEISRDHKIPDIKAKRIKGCLRKEAYELRDCEIGAATKENLEELFGKSGQAGSGLLQVFDAHIYKAPVFNQRSGEKKCFEIEDYEKLKRELNQSEELSEREVLEAFTQVRTRTALDEKSGAAQKASLRSARVLKRGIVLKCDVILHSDRKELEELLRLCVSGLRHMGMEISRGLGEISCQLVLFPEEKPVCEEQAVPIPNVGREKVELTFSLELLSPVIVSGSGGRSSCEEEITGSAILGALAGMYLEDYGLGKNAHEDETFSRIFLNGGVQFGYAFPSTEENVFYPCPRSWQQIKDEEAYYDLAFLKPEAELRGISHWIYRENDGTLVNCKPEKELRMHHMRPADRGIAHALGEEESRGDSLLPLDQKMEQGNPGQFFQYTALSAGQTFEGTLRGSANDIKELTACLEKRNFRLRLGRSRTAEYGNVRWKTKRVEELSKKSWDEGQYRYFTLWLLTPMLLADKATGRMITETKAFEEALCERLGCPAAIEKQFLRFTLTGGYHARWGLPKPQYPALAAGSAFLIRSERPVKAAQIEQEGWGENTAEGFGRMKLFGYKESVNFTSCSKKMKLRPLPEKRIGKGNEKEPPTPLFAALMENKRYQEELGRIREEAQPAVPIQINATTIEQLIRIAGEAEDSKGLKEKVSLIQNENKRKKVLNFIKPCENKDPLFLKAYLENAKWIKRREEADGKRGKL